MLISRRPPGRPARPAAAVYPRRPVRPFVVRAGTRVVLGVPSGVSGRRAGPGWEGAAGSGERKLYSRLLVRDFGPAGPGRAAPARAGAAAARPPLCRPPARPPGSASPPSLGLPALRSPPTVLLLKKQPLALLRSPFLPGACAAPPLPAGAVSRCPPGPPPPSAYRCPFLPPPPLPSGADQLRPPPPPPNSGLRGSLPRGLGAPEFTENKLSGVVAGARWDSENTSCSPGRSVSAHAGLEAHSSPAITSVGEQFLPGATAGSQLFLALLILSLPSPLFPFATPFPLK